MDIKVEQLKADGVKLLYDNRSCAITEMSTIGPV